MYTSILRKSTIFLMVLSFFSTVSAANYYLSATGNDANAGTTPATAWLTFANVNTTNFAPGDFLFLEGGSTFTGTIFLDANDADGGAANPFVIDSYGAGNATINAGNGFGIYTLNTAGLEIRNLIVTGSGMNVNTEYGVRMVNDLPGNIKKDYIRITNLIVSGFREVGISFLGDNGDSGFNDIIVSNCIVHDCLDRGIDMWGDFNQFKTGYSHSNLLVENCEVYNIIGYNKGEHSGNGIVMSDVQNAVIEYCVAYDCGFGNTNCGGPVGIWFWDSDQVVIQYCESYNISSGTVTGCDGGGFDLDGGVTNGTMQYNYSHDNDGAGYLIGQFSVARPMSNITCRYNISQNDALTNGGSTYLFNLSTGTINNVQIYNNTFYLSNSPTNPQEANFYMLDFLPGYTNIDVYNNIFYSNGGVDLIYIPVGAGYDADFYGNLYYSTGAFNIDYKGTNYGNLNAFRTGSGKEIWNATNTGIEGNPGLISPGTGGIIGFGNPLTTLFDYQLITGALAYNNGLDLATEFGLNVGPQDFYGNPSFSSASQDIGAYETQTLLPNIRTSLRAELEQNQIQLTWTGTWGDERGTFEVFHSVDSQSWTSMKSVAYTAAELRQPQYFHTYSQPEKGLHAFIVTFTSLDGKTSQSEVAYINVGEVNSFAVFPIPFEDEIIVRTRQSNNSEVTFELTDLQGRTVWQIRKGLSAGVETVLTVPENIPSGTFVLTIATQTELSRIQVIKK